MCLLAAIEAFCGFEFDTRVGDIPIDHNAHYQRAHEKSYGYILFGKDMKYFSLLTRQEAEPFVQPFHESKYSPIIEDSDDHSIGTFGLSRS